MKPAANLPPPAERPACSDIYPLDDFCAARGEMPPVIDIIEAGLLPEPYCFLLDHKADMTSTLEKFYGETLHIEVLERRQREEEYYREVALVLDGTKRRVEFGAIKINLNFFPPEARQEILREQQPLGRILNGFNIPFSSRPTAFLRLVPDHFIVASLQLPAAQPLYGRRNSLFDSLERPLAEIVEILPP